MRDIYVGARVGIFFAFLLLEFYIEQFFQILKSLAYTLGTSASSAVLW